MNRSRKPDSSEYYQIRLKGNLNAKWSDWFSGMTISIQGGVTTLTGLVTDQAALHGILIRVRDLGLPLISVNQIEVEIGKKAQQPGGKESTDEN